MIRTAVVGIGHWGRTVINAVQGRSGKIRFVAGQTRTPSKVEAFCAEKGIASDIEMIAIQQVNEAYERLLKSDVKYRFVIDMASLKK